jgi:choline dehydrogenase-like flavoprotein
MTRKDGESNMDALDRSEPFDVCIIGSGFAGTVLGTELVQRGVRTLIVESGNSMLRWLFDSRMKNLAAFQASGDTNYPLKHMKTRILGGNSNFWTGRCERFHPSDFNRNPYTPPENPWPITYEELEPYYSMAEDTLRVRGGTLSKYTPPRNTPLPLPPSPDISFLKSTFGKIGVTVDDSPTATPTKGLRFFRVQKEVLPRLLASPHATLVSGVTVTRLIPDLNRRIVEAEAKTLDLKQRSVIARYYVLACGGIETPRLLLLSRSEQFPNGIGNAHDKVGRGFNEHAGVNFYAKIRHSWGTICPTNKVGRTHQFYDRFRSEGLGSVLPVFRQSWILFHHILPRKLSKLPENLFSLFTRLSRPTLYAGATIEMRISESNRVTLSKDKTDLLGNPIAHLTFNYSEDDLRTLDRARDVILKIYNNLGATGVKEADVTWSRHHQGTCRMGVNPTASVTDSNLRVHESPNLYLCGSEVFATGGATPPVLTITALAHRLADHLTIRLRGEC